MAAHAIPLLAALYALLTGLCIGSFLNVCIYRIPVGASIVTPRSHCPECGALIPWNVNIPVLGWLALRGRCRYCACRISPRYVAIEALTGFLFMLTALAVRWPLWNVPLALEPLTPAQGLVFWVAHSGLIVATFVDLDWMIIPDRISIGGFVLGLVASALVPELHGVESWSAGLGLSLASAAFGYGLLSLVATVGRWAFKREAMGYGDVKLMAAIGAFFGWPGVLFSLVAGAFAGSIIGVALIARHGRALGSRLPFGPCLALGAALWSFWGRALVRAYLSFVYTVP